MQVLYDEGVANHIAPEPCMLFREEQDEASAGDRVGWPSSRERSSPGRRRGYAPGRQHRPLRQREWRAGPAWSENPACTDAPCSGTGISRC